MSERKRFIDRVQKAATRNFMEYGRAAAMFVGVRDQRFFIMPLDGMEKDKASLVVQTLRRACTLAAMVSECWMTVRHPAEKVLPPSECPDRKEILMVTLYEGEKVTCSWADIVREGGGKPSLGPWIAQPNLKRLAGRFGDGTSVSDVLQPWRQ